VCDYRRLTEARRIKEHIELPEVVDVGREPCRRSVIERVQRSVIDEILTEGVWMANVEILNTVAREAIHPSSYLGNRVRDQQVSSHLSGLASLESAPLPVGIEIPFEFRTVTLYPWL